MKHIKRKFLNQVVLKKNGDDRPLLEILGTEDTATELMNNAKLPKDYIPYFITEDSMYSGFQIRVNGKNRIIPEPDPILVYYSTAYFNYKAIEAAKMKVLDRTQQTIGEEPAIDELYEYFGLVSCVVIFLFMSLESAMNRCIPEDYIFKETMPNKTEIYTKSQIEKNFSFDKKLKALKIISHKNFQNSYGIKFQHIVNLKNFRDDIVHTKSHNQGQTASNHNYRRSFEFDFESTMKAVKDFCNFYLGDELIVDCPCTNEW